MNAIGIVLLLGLYAFIHVNRRKTMKEIEDLTTQVQETNTVIDSAITLIRGLKERLDLALGGGDVVQAIRNLRDDLNRKEEELAQAVSANTPAEGGETGEGGTGGGTDPGTDPNAGSGGTPEGGDTGAGGAGGAGSASAQGSARRS